MFQAMQRFTVLSEWLYPQYITWDRLTLEVKPTSRSKRLIPMMLSSLVAFKAVSFVYFLTRQVVSYHKDKDITFNAGVLLILASSGYSIAVVISHAYIFRVDGLRFILKNLSEIKGEGAR